MTGEERREQILNIIMSSGQAVPAKKIAEEMEVSRQVIVQDVALLRASGYDIIATNRGYILQNSAKIGKLIKTAHTEEQLEDELCTIVDLGGEVMNVIVNHRVYGRMEAPLRIASRRDVREFMNDIRSGKSSPLMNITSTYHFHEIFAENETIMDEILEALKEKGYLIEIMEGKELW